jgi:hypothetical protein
MPIGQKRIQGEIHQITLADKDPLNRRLKGMKQRSDLTGVRRGIVV